MCKFEMYVHLRIRPFNLNFRYMATRTYWTYTRVLQCSHSSVGFAQACPNQQQQDSQAKVLVDRKFMVTHSH